MTTAPDRAVTPRRRGRRGSGVDVRPKTIRQARLAAGLTMEQLAGDDLTRGAIYLFESGRARPSQATLELIADRTGKPLSFFLADGDGREGAAADRALVIELAAAEGRHEDVVTATAEALRGDAGDRQALLRLLHASAQLALGYAEIAVSEARAARDAAPEHAEGRAIRAEARLVEAAALRAAGDPAALDVARDAVAEAAALDPPSIGLAARGRWLVAEIAEEHGDPDLAREELEALLDGAPVAAFVRATADGQELLAVDHEAGDRSTEAAVARARAVSLLGLERELRIVADAWVRLGTLLTRGDDLGAGRAELERALRYAEAVGAAGPRARALLALAEAAIADGDRDEARRRLEHATAVSEQAADHRGLALARLVAARVAAADLDEAVADAAFRDAIAMVTELGDMELLADAHVQYAEWHEARGRIAEALEHWKQAAGNLRPQVPGAADA